MCHVICNRNCGMENCILKFYENSVKQSYVDYLCLNL